MTERDGATASAGGGSAEARAGDAAVLDAVHKVYKRGGVSRAVQALRGLDLVIPHNDYVAVMGPSGSGKSTLMNVLGCLDRPTSGRYLLAGQDVATMDDHELSRARGRHLGFVFQGFNLIPQLSVLENTEVPLFYAGVSRAECRRIAAESVERVGLEDRSHHRPSQLSGGQQQRAAIARALVNQPSLLLADEPTGNLDSVSGGAVLDLFDELHGQGLTVVMVTHDRDVASRCRRVVQLNDGRVVSDRVTV